MASSSGPRDAGVNGLRVLTLKQNDFTVLPPGNPVFDCMAAIASLALDILECQSSRVALTAITSTVVSQSQDIPELRGLTYKDYEPRVLYYLGSVRRSFPQVLVTNENSMVNKNGRTNKRDCPGTFSPKTAAVIEINADLVDRMVKARTDMLAKTSDYELKKRRFRNLHFRLAITMAHELVHVFQLFLRRSQTRHTPPQLTYGGYGDRFTGESGRFWESRVLGGYVDMRDSSQDAKQNMEYIVLRDNHDQKCFRIKSEVIDGILNRQISAWLLRDYTLTDADHPKAPTTERIAPHVWKTKYYDIFPAISGTSQAPRELSEAKLSRLFGQQILSSPCYNLDGRDVRDFSLQPQIRMRSVRA